MAAVSQLARVVIADDDERTRALLTILSYSPAVEVVGEAADGAEAVKVALERREGDGVLVTDVCGRLLFYDSGAADLLVEPFPASGPFEDFLRRHPIVNRDRTRRPLETTPPARALAERRPVTDEVCELRGDVLRVYEMSAVPVFAEGDHLVGSAASVRLLCG